MQHGITRKKLKLSYYLIFIESVAITILVYTLLGRPAPEKDADTPLTQPQIESPAPVQTEQIKPETQSSTITTQPDSKEIEGFTESDGTVRFTCPYLFRLHTKLPQKDGQRIKILKVEVKGSARLVKEDGKFAFKDCVIKDLDLEYTLKAGETYQTDMMTFQAGSVLRLRTNRINENPEPDTARCNNTQTQKEFGQVESVTTTVRYSCTVDILTMNEETGAVGNHYVIFNPLEEKQLKVLIQEPKQATQPSGDEVF